MTRVKISVILATRNRADLLAGTVNSLADQSLGPENYEVIVVDNGSTDNTAELVQKFIAANPGLFRLIHEPVPGLSVSRNAGIRQARFEAFAFLDDDAIADNRWLECLSEALEDDQVGAAGGAVQVRWTTEKPAWHFPEFDRWVYSRLDFGPDRKLLPPGQLLFGPNLALKREALAQVGLFSEGLGRQGKKLLSYEEVEMQDRIVRAGFRIAYHPGAVVHHLALPERNTLPYLRRHAWNHGRSRRAYETATGSPRRSLLLMPFVLLKGAAGYFLKHRMSLAKQRELIYLAGYFFQGLNDLFHPPRLSQPPRL